MFYDEDGEPLEHVVQRNCGCPVIGSAPDKVGQSYEQPNLVEDVPPNTGGKTT